jgi:uncharacterized RDD family membrane protein YckC
VPPVAFQQYQQYRQYALAPYWARLGALLLDGVFAMLLAIPAIIVVVAIIVSMQDARDEDAAIGLAIVGYLVALIPSMYYSFCKDGFKGGASWGKRLCGLRVVHLETGQPCTKGRSFLRQVLYFVNFYGIVSLIEIIMVYANPQRRRLGDMIAGTMVTAAGMPVPQSFPPPWPTQPPQYLDSLSRDSQQQPQRPPGPYDRPPLQR